MARSRIIAGKAVIIIEAQELVNKTLAKVRSNLHKFANEVGNLGETAFRTGFFGSIASGAIIGSFVKFDDAMRTLRVNLDLFGRSAQQVDRVMRPLEARIRSLAQTTPFAPTEVASAATQLAKGGFQPKQIEQALQAVLDLSRATNTELDFASEFVIRTHKTFGVATARASEVVSQMVRAARKGTLSIEDLAASMTYSSGTADTLGVSLQKMLAIFTVLSNRGLVGSIAGTSTNTAFSQLVKKAQELKDIGKIDIISGFREDGREAIDVIDALEKLFKYADSLPFVEQQTLFQDVFNLRGSRAVSGLRKEIAQVKNLTKFISEAGDEAREAARIQDEGIGGSLRRLLSTIQDLNIALGQSTEKVIIGIASAVKGLLEELNKLASLNPVLTSLVILSPGILLGAGVGLLALSKALRVAAYGAGALKAALLPLTRFVTKGTIGQVALLSQVGKVKRGPAALAKVASDSGVQLANARKQLSISKARAASQAKLATLLTKKAQAETILAKIVQKRGVGTGASEFARAATTRASATAAARNARLAGGAVSAARAAAFANLAKGATTLGTRGASGIASFTKGMLSFLNTTRRFVFSTTGVLTILEGLILFGDKIPGVSTVLERFGNGFSNAFKAIGNIAKFAAGPIALLKASIEAFTAGRSDLGIQGLSTAFSGLVSIIGNQLVAAWNRFKAAIAPVYDTIVALFTTISVTITSIVNSISEAVGATFSTQKTLLGSLTGGLFGSSGGLASAASSIGEAIAHFIPQLFNWLAQLSVVFNEAAQRFIVGIEHAFSVANPFNNQDKADSLYEAQLADIKNDAKASRKLLAIDLAETQAAISKAFAQSSLQRSRRNATGAVNNSAARMQEAFVMAQAIRQELAKIIPQAASSSGQFPQQITPEGIRNAPGVRSIVQMVEALVGSAQSTNRNLLKAGKPIEQKQLEEQQKTNEILKSMATDKGILFAP